MRGPQAPTLRAGVSEASHALGTASASWRSGPYCFTFYFDIRFRRKLLRFDRGLGAWVWLAGMNAEACVCNKCRQTVHRARVKRVRFVLCVSHNEKQVPGASLVVRWLRLRASSAGSPGAIPGQGTRPRVPPLTSQCARSTWTSARGPAAAWTGAVGGRVGLTGPPHTHTVIRACPGIAGVHHPRDSPVTARL